MFHANSSIWLPSFLGTRKQSHRYQIAFFYKSFYNFSYQIESQRNISLRRSNLIKKNAKVIERGAISKLEKIKFLFFVTTQVRRDAEKETLFFLLFGLLQLFFFCSLDRRGKEFNNLFILMTVGEENGSTFDCPWSAIDQWFWSWNRSQHSGIIIRTELKSVVKFLFSFVYLHFL